MHKTNPLRGVNLGGWLVLERWMTPSLFAGTTATNEFELSKTKQGRERIKKHHQTFITETDLKWLKEQKIELLRVPVGYWIFGQDDRYVGATERLDWLVETSLSYGFKLMLDLHAAPEAQNDTAHSGSGDKVRNKHSTKWLNDIPAQTETIEILTQIVERYRHFSHVWGIELLNEPSRDLLGFKLIRFYRRAYKALRKVVRPGTVIVFSDAYAPLLLTGALRWFGQKDAPVMMDCHFYQCFTAADRLRPFESQLKKTIRRRRLIKFLSLWQPIIVGEWSGVLPYKTSLPDRKRYLHAQQSSHETAAAQCYWNYKTEFDEGWGYRHVVNLGLLQ